MDLRSLPVDDAGQRYLTDQMLANDTVLAKQLDATINSWYRDELNSRWVLYPSVGREL